MINISDKTNCCGCTACKSICTHQAITMKPDEQGFLYPCINIDKCTNCGLCEKVCPITNNDKRNASYQTIYAARTKQDDVLMRSSSGGMFYTLASYVVAELKGIVIGVKYDENMVVKHAVADTLDGLKCFHGSKYVQSHIEGIFEITKRYLEDKRYVLFTGTPCQVHALKLFLKKEYENLLTMDLICHSVPSPLIFKEYVNFVEQKVHKKLVSIDMRNKKKGWSHAFYYYYYFADGTSLGDDKLGVAHWGKLFFSGLITRPSCNQCRFTNLRRTGDITVADYWDDSNKRPDTYSNKGTSLVIINTQKGREIYDTIKTNVDFWVLTESEAMQPCLQHPHAANPKRELFWTFYNKHGFSKSYKKFFTTPWYSKGYKLFKKCAGVIIRKCGLK